MRLEEYALFHIQCADFIGLAAVAAPLLDNPLVCEAELYAVFLTHHVIIQRLGGDLAALSP